MSATPATIIAAIAALSGIYWLTKSRDKTEEE